MSFLLLLYSHYSFHSAHATGALPQKMLHLQFFGLEIREVILFFGREHVKSDGIFKRFCVL